MRLPLLEFNEDTFTDALSKFTGMKFDACPRCNELLAHRGGKALPCHNPKCPAKGKPVTEGRRHEDEKDWIASHPGFQFGVYDGKVLLSIHPSIPVARRVAKSSIRPGTDIRIKDILHPDRVYFREDCVVENLPGADKRNTWKVARAKTEGFDLTTLSGNLMTAKCSKCDVINPTRDYKHESGCPNEYMKRG